MTEPHLNQTSDIPPPPADSLDAGLAAGFRKRAEPPRSSLGGLRPVLLKEAEGESAHIVKPKSDEMPAREETGERYLLQGEIARGGMGVVLRGRDVDLGRDLAVKVLLEKHADRPEVARRFLEEAQIGGQLQHPGVVPVYDIGHFGDRPFFTMKLVKGQTLAAILAERTDPATDRPRLLGIASKVAETLAYAHAKGVIHRDLKPANIMVGAFGEVQVMDWGLAKVLAEGGIADEERASRAQQEPQDVTTIRTARSSGSTGRHGTDTEAGSILGTPAYMPPEQASGDVALLDRRADVFGLGAILCEVLTGKPPYVGRSAEEVRRQAANGDLADATARLDACGADAELIALTKRCLAAEAIDRPKDAREVADGLSAYLEGVQERLQTAERERAVAVAREAEQRKRLKVQLALAAAVVGLLLGGGAFAWWRNEQAQVARQREVRNAEAVAALLNQAQEALEAGDAAKAKDLVDAARARSAEGGADGEAARLGRLEADLALLIDLDAVDQFRWTAVENKLPDPAEVATRTREALERFGIDPDAVSVDEAAARASASVVLERIVSALDRLLMQEKTAGVRALLRQVDAEPYRDAVRDAVLAGDRPRLVALAGQLAALEQPPGFAAFLGESEVIGVERRRQLLQAALSRRSGDLGLLMTLGLVYSINQKEGADERLRWYQAAVAAAPANSAARNNLGNVLHNKGQVDEAIACYHQAIALAPKFALPHYNLGNALKGKGQVEEAIGCYRQAIALDPKYANAHTNLGNALADKGQLEEAIASFRQAIALDPKYALAHYNLGNALKDKGQLDEAIACYRKAIALDPKYAQAHCNLGHALASQGQFAESLAALERGHELGTKQPGWPYPSAAWLRQAQAKAALEPKLPAFLQGEFQPRDNNERLGLASVCHAKKLPHTAAGLYAAAFAADPRLADVLLARHRYHAACSAAIAAAGQGEDAAKLDEATKAKLRGQALAWLKADLTAWAKLLDSGPSQARQFIVQALSQWQKDSDLAGLRDEPALARLPTEERKAWARLWADVATLLKQANTPSLGSLLEQLPTARKALPKDSPQLAGLLAQIGQALLEQQKWTEAEPLLRECLTIRQQKQPEDWRTFNTRSLLGGALLGQKKYADAEPLLLAGYAGMKEREKTIPPQGRARLTEAVQRLVQLYQATGKQEEVSKWQAELHKLEPSAKPEKKL